ncbi:MAG: DUF11 domain-containing protein [Clostridiales Family XIII bacterium]|jgi:uncharacterized repeat protein (TIGR01451 family)|nr:DUF11 domain-containing protein [Clostridiales Family XIII bacterium]
MNTKNGNVKILRQSIAFIIATLMVVSMIIPNFAYAAGKDSVNDADVASTEALNVKASDEAIETSEGDVAVLDNPATAEDVPVEPAVNETPEPTEDTPIDVVDVGATISEQAEASTQWREASQNDDPPDGAPRKSAISALASIVPLGVDFTFPLTDGAKTTVYRSFAPTDFQYNTSVMNTLKDQGVAHAAVFANHGARVSFYFAGGNRAVYCFEPGNNAISVVPPGHKDDYTIYNENTVPSRPTGVMDDVQKEMLAYVLANGQPEYTGYWAGRLGSYNDDTIVEWTGSTAPYGLVKQSATQICTWLIGENSYKKDDVIRNAMIPVGGTGFAPSAEVAKLANQYLDAAYASLTSTPTLPALTEMTWSNSENAYVADLNDDESDGDNAFGKSPDGQTWKNAIIAQLQNQGLTGSFVGNTLHVKGEPTTSGKTINVTIKSAQKKALIAYLTYDRSGLNINPDDGYYQYAQELVTIKTEDYDTSRSISFKLWRQPADGAAQFKAKKTVTGLSGTRAVFRFTYEQVNNATGDAYTGPGDPLVGLKDTSGNIEPSQVVTFDKLTGLTRGRTYYFKVVESKGTLRDWEYSKEIYIVKAEVPAGGGDAQITYLSSTGGNTSFNNDNPPTFTNKYTASVDIPFDIIKKSVGKDMTAGEFKFGVFKADEDGKIQGSALVTASNGAVAAGRDIVIKFADINLTTAAVGENYFIIKETTTNDVPANGSGWKLDPTLYLAKVIVRLDEQTGAPILSYERPITYKTSKDGGKTWTNGWDDISSKDFTNRYEIYDAALRKWVSEDYRLKRDGSIKQVYDKDDELLLEKNNTPSTPVPVAKGDIVKYTIKVFNQGNMNAKIPQIVDYLPAELAFPDSDKYNDTKYPSWSAITGNNAGWTVKDGTLIYNYKKDSSDKDTVIASGENYKGSGDVILAPGASKEISVYLVVKSAPTEGKTTIDNFAEISEFNDDKGNEVIDVDSTPDAIDGNDGWKPDNSDDNEIDEHRKDDSSKDEDDHDIAQINVGEPGSLILTKSVPSITDKNLFEFRITTADDNKPVDLTKVDYDFVWTPPAIQASNTQLKDGIIFLNDEGQVMIEGLTPGTKYVITERSVTGSAVGNIVLGDYHTTYEVVATNGTATGSGVTTPNDVTVDKDTITNVTFKNTPKYDTAIRKWVYKYQHATNPAVTVPTQGSLGADGPNGEGGPKGEVTAPSVRIGDLVTYKIRVFNQSKFPTKITDITDYLPNGLAFVTENASGEAINKYWKTDVNASGAAILRYTGPAIELAPYDGKANDGQGDDEKTLKVILKVVSPEELNAHSYINDVEISKMTDEEDNEVPDEDSTPDDIDEETPTDNEIHEAPEDSITPDDDEKAGPDEDDHDIAEVVVKQYDVALRKWIPQVERKVTGATSYVKVYTSAAAEYNTAVPVQIGDRVTFAIDLFNQCNEEVIIPHVKDYIGPGYEFITAAGVNQNWEYDAAKNIATYTQPVKFIAWDKDAEGAYLDAEKTQGNYPKHQILITLKVVKTDNDGKKIPTGTERYNYAEISELTDVNHNEVDDVDSIPDNKLDNDGERNPDTWVPTGSGLNPIKDNEIEEHGLKPDGTKVDRKDEDDHDFAKVIDREYDVALRKWVSSVSTNGAIGSFVSVDDEYAVSGPAVGQATKPAIVKVGNYVNYGIRVFNQGKWTTKITEISDYIPSGLEFVTANALGEPINAGWTAKTVNGKVLATLIPNPSIRLLPQGSVDDNGDATDAYTVNVILKVKKPAPNATQAALINAAEISDITDDNDNPVEDIDSTPDDENEETPKDNEVDEHGPNDEDNPGDEDDHDIAEVTVKEYDVALRKWIPSVDRDVTWDKKDEYVNVYKSTSPEAIAVPVQVGDKVTFAIDLFNQSLYDVQISQVTDYIGKGLSFIEEDNPNWTYDSDTGYASYSGPAFALKAWDGKGKGADAYPSTTTSIVLKVNKLVDTGTERYNYAEITELLDSDGDVVEDIDSVPDGEKYDDGDINPDTDVPTDSGINPIKDNEIDEHDLDSNGEEIYEYEDDTPTTGYDQDDHDYARVVDRVYDLALRKWVSFVSTSGAVDSGKQIDGDYALDGPTAGAVVKPPVVQVGDYVTYKIRVFNQGEWATKFTSVTDYLPSGMEFVTKNAAGTTINSDWKAGKNDSGLNIITFTTKPSIELAPQHDPDGNDAYTLEVILKVKKPDKENAGQDVPLINAAEISGMTDDEDNPVEDEDSTPDDEDNETPKDNEVDEHGPGPDEDNPSTDDEDDHDIAEVVLKFYDAALRKWVTTVDHGGDVRTIDDTITGPTGKSPVPSVYVGDLITYNIRLFNQTENPVTLTAITDYLPDGLELVTTGAIGQYWKATGAKTTYDNAGTKSTYTAIEWIGADIFLDAYDGSYGSGNDEKTIQIQARVKNPTDISKATQNLDNYAEISEMVGEEDTPVQDIDSTPDTDLPNDKFDYDKDNEIDEHQEGDDAKKGDDQDDHDIARVELGIIISVEVDKDTIKRTSAAYKSLPNKEGIDNIGDAEERYKYDFDFRSTSTIETEEFVVDDRLENVTKTDGVRVEEFWTPIVWGDINGTYNIWYKTNKTDDTKTYSNVRDNKSATKLGTSQTFSNKGFKLWKENSPSADNDNKVISGQGLDVRYRYHLLVSKLGLDADEYITAIRLEYGAVKPGFTSKNSKDKSINGEHRANDGSVNLPSSKAGTIKPLSIPGNAVTTQNIKLGGSIATFATGIDNNYVDWTVKPSDGYYNAGLAADQGLKAASYLVSATNAMDDEDIVSSVDAHIARDTMVDQDQDAVVTREIQTFEANPEDLEIDKAVIDDNSFVKHGEEAGLITRGGGDTPEITDKGKDNFGKEGKVIPRVNREGVTLKDSIGNIMSPKTGDPVKLVAIYATMLAALSCIVLLVVLQLRARKRNRVQMVTKREEV